jgi:DNA sulfur modification protein DndC
MHSRPLWQFAKGHHGSLRQVNPAQFAQVARYEAALGCTIRRDRTTVVAAADQGRLYPSITAARIAEALDDHWDRPIILPDGKAWHLPAGAFGDRAGPT